ncbi:MAG: hypothetical protein HYS13_05420 [Planctomycetia bacterium]|nr:hypothetical protein [Planctomycetia bacterium]
MDQRQWLESARRELKRHRLPRRYVRRLVAEFSDHIDDLTEETMTAQVSTLDRLGNPETVARGAAQEYRRRPKTWVSVLAFVVLPVPAFALAFGGLMFGIGSITALTGLDQSLRERAGSLTALDRSLIDGAVVAIIVAALALVATVLGLVGQRRRARWTIIGCTLLAAVGGVMFHQLTLSAALGQSNFSIGLGFPPGQAHQIVQFAAPLAIGLIFAWRQWAGRKSRAAACAES